MSELGEFELAKWNLYTTEPLYKARMLRTWALGDLSTGIRDCRVSLYGKDMAPLAVWSWRYTGDSVLTLHKTSDKEEYFLTAELIYPPCLYVTPDFQTPFYVVELVSRKDEVTLIETGQFVWEKPGEAPVAIEGLVAYHPEA